MSVDIKIIKLKVRRGTNSQRQRVVLDQGEVGFTTDTQRLFVGNGVLSGGVAVGSKVFSPRTTLAAAALLPAELGDIVFVNTEGCLYQLTNLPASDVNSWTKVGTNPDGVYMGYDGGTLTLLDNSIDGLKLNQQSLSSETITFNSDSLVVNYSTQFTVNTAAQLAVANGGISYREINSSALAGGLSGGSGNRISVKVDGETIAFDSNGRLKVIDAAATVVKYTDLDKGFTVNPLTDVVDTVVQGVTWPLVLNNGSATLQRGFSSIQELPMFNVNDYGVINSTSSSIYDVITGTGTNEFKGCIEYPSNCAGNTSSTVLSNFNGSYITKNITSAGFIVFQGNTGGPRQRPDIDLQPFAVPVFRFT